MRLARSKSDSAIGERFVAIESFCGPGGMALGLSRAGFEVVLSFDIDERAIETVRRNQGHRAIVLNAEHASGKHLRTLAGLGDRDLDLFSGGPPCQGFSKQKRGAHNGDERNRLITEFARLVEELCPKFFLLENVAIFGQKRGRAHLRELEVRLANSYAFFPHFYCCADYGLAQTRERFILVGQRNDVPGAFSPPRAATRVWRTVGDVLSAIPEPPHDFSVHPDFPNHQRARVTRANVERFAFVPQGGGWQDIPVNYRLDCHKTVDPSSGGWPDVYGRLEWNGQCPTITGGFDSFTRGRYGHPLHDRPLTPHEASRLQGFPAEYCFCGTRADVRSQIGNAVPPPLAEAVGREVLRVLSGRARHDAVRPGRQITML